MNFKEFIMIMTVIGIGLIVSCQNKTHSNKDILLYKSKTYEDIGRKTFHKVVFGDYFFYYEDSVSIRYPYLDMEDEQIITNRQFIFANGESLTSKFLNYLSCAINNSEEPIGLQELNNVFLFPNGDLGLLMYEDYSSGANGVCGRACYYSISIYAYSDFKELNLITKIKEDGCRGSFSIDNQEKEGAIEKIYWKDNKLILHVFEDENPEQIYQFNIKTKKWIKK